jgi:DNA polymerase V
LRTVLEERCFGRDQLIFSRSFSKSITTAADLRQVMRVHAQKASARPAKHGLQAVRHPGQPDAPARRRALT